MTKRLNTILCALFLMAVTIVMWFLNHFTPLYCDDWHYVFIFGTQTPIQTLGDIIVSQWHHYFEFTNGRFFAHFFVQLFDGILGKTLFNIFNAVFFAVFLYLLAYVTSRDKSQYYKIISVAFLLIFFLMTGFKYEFLWMSGSCNYLWMAIMLLIFHHLLEKEEISNRMRLPLLLFSFICGWSNEAMVVGLGGAYFFYFAFHRKRLSGHRLWMMIGFYLGALFLVFSPASVNRALHHGVQQLSLMDRLVNMGNLHLFFVMIALLVIKVLFKQTRFAEWVKREQILVMAVVISFVFIIFTGFYLQHSRFGIELFSLLLILRMIEWKRINNGIITVANVAMLAFAGYVIVLSSKCYAVNQQELSHVPEGQSLILTSDPIGAPCYIHRFVLDYSGSIVTDGINDVKLYGEDDWIPNYYGFKNRFVCFLPKLFIDDINAHPEAYQQFRTLDELSFYAIRLKPGQGAWHVNLVYEPSKYNKLPWPLNRLCAKLANEVDEDVSAVKLVTINGERFALVPKIRPSQDNRLKELQLVDYPEWSKPAMTSEPEEIWSHFF